MKLDIVTERVGGADWSGQHALYLGSTLDGDGTDVILHIDDNGTAALLLDNRAGGHELVTLAVFNPDGITRDGLQLGGDE